MSPKYFRGYPCSLIKVCTQILWIEAMNNYTCLFQHSCDDNVLQLRYILNKVIILFNEFYDRLYFLVQIQWVKVNFQNLVQILKLWEGKLNTAMLHLKMVEKTNKRKLSFTAPYCLSVKVHNFPEYYCVNALGCSVWWKWNRHQRPYYLQTLLHLKVAYDPIYIL